MADNKTHLRELGVIVGVFLLLKKITKSVEEITPQEFYSFCLRALRSKDILLIRDELKKDSFNSNEIKILKNSFELSSAIFKNFKLKSTDKIVWCGANNHGESPVDFMVGEYNFSLKEESFILENMGLYKYLSLMTGNNYDRGINIFEMFAHEAYQTLFSFVWNKLINEKQHFSYQGSSYSSEIIFLENSVKFKYKSNDKEVYSILPLEKNLPIAKFNELTKSTTREKVFSKWLKENLERNGQYQGIKKGVSELAAANLVSHVKDNLDLEYKGLKRFLRVHKASYFYAKSTIAGVKIYKVPSLEDFSHIFTIDKIYYAVPQSQVNIYTEIKNKINNQVLVLRNEVRFSHGQFNGVPEAKMYYNRDGNLETIYEKIC